MLVHFAISLDLVFLSFFYCLKLSPTSVVSKAFKSLLLSKLELILSLFSRDTASKLALDLALDLVTK